MKILALLLLVALLSCHGLLGAPQHDPVLADHSHLAAHLTEEHPSHAPTGNHDAHPGMHLGHSGYAAVLISFLLGAVLVLLLDGARSWNRVIVPLVFDRRFHPIVLPPPRGPTASLIQVFRL